MSGGVNGDGYSSLDDSKDGDSITGDGTSFSEDSSETSSYVSTIVGS